MRTGLQAFALVFALSALTGCVNFGDKDDAPAVVHYVLKDPTPSAAGHPVRPDALKDADPLRAKARVESYAPTLLVLDTTTGGYYDTHQFIFSRSPDTRGQYQFARWTERPGKRFANLMRARIDQQGAWHVSAAGGYVQGDLMLDTELVEFYHDAASAPGVMRLELRAELVDLKQRKLLGRRVFKQDVPLASYDAAGAALASNQAVGLALDELTAWLSSLR